MSNVRFIGCLHFGHEKIAKMRGFKDSFDHDRHLISMWNKTVSKRDLTFILGDVTMEDPDYYCYLNQMNGRKIVVMGNHDLHRDVRQLLKHVESVAGMIKYKGFFLTHAPIHPNDLGRCKGNIHAHIHENKLIEVMAESHWKDSDSEIVPTLHKYYNVDAKMIDFIPKSLIDLTK